MKKLNIVFLLLLVAGMHSLFAQEVQEVQEAEVAAEAPAAAELASPESPDELEGTSEAVDQAEGIITVKATPSVSGKGRVYFSGDKTLKGHNLYTDGDAKGRVKFEADYDGIGGAVIELEGKFNRAEAISSGGDGIPYIVGFGDNAYAYAHVLQAFGVDAKIFDVYLKSGRFKVGFDNAEDAGQDDWKANVDGLDRDDKTNMQLDLKIMDMLTVRYGTSFAMIDSGDSDYDMGWGLLFDKSFGDHNIKASVGYVVDFTDNTDYNFGDESKLLKKEADDWDNLGISVAYTGTFGAIKIMPFANLSLKGLLAHPALSYVNPLIGWSAGLKFQLRDDADKYDLVGVGLDLDGEMRDNNNYYEKLDKKGEVKQKYTANKAFSGFGLKVWTHALRSMMGDNYLSLWAKARFDLNQPDKMVVYDQNDPNTPLWEVEISREGYLGSWGLGLTQRFVNQENASVALSAEFGMENIAPFKVNNDIGYVGSETSIESKNAAFKTYLDISLNASFTSVFKQSVK